MKIEFWAIGKHKSDQFEECMKIYLGRIKHVHKVSFKYFKEAKSKNTSPLEIKKEESQNLLNHFEPKIFYIVLDETGKQFSSVQFAKELAKVQSNPAFDKLIFCIGGAYGFDEAIRKKSNLVMSLSSMTFPHKMVKLFLMEQIYRAHTIQTNHGYHKI